MSPIFISFCQETKRLQTCWLELREDFKTVYRLVLEEAWGDSNRPKPSLDSMTESVHKLVWRDPHQLYQRLESQLRDFVMELRMRLVDLLQKQAKNPNLAQVWLRHLCLTIPCVHFYKRENVCRSSSKACWEATTSFARQESW